ncbi:MAG: sulfite exporter TauE/SafE family protein [Gammaproteobacteria bacterium]|nr:sulfite exporter TauE/SafE family protein [Gammaproteobacteria bacterium]
MGFFSTIHCIGMCGGIMGALTLSATSPQRTPPVPLWRFWLFFNFGRIIGYTLAGVLVGLIGSTLYDKFVPADGYLWLQGLAAVMVAAMGLHIAGWLPKLAQLERLGAPIWRRIEPLGRSLLPVKSPHQALLYGLIWGWMPCGLVYTTLLYTLMVADAMTGALMMFTFGLGTLPAMAGVSHFSRQLYTLRQRPRVRHVAGVTLVMLAISGLFFADWLHPVAQFPPSLDMECRSE